MIELYTSEGCSSCPRADRWLSTLAFNEFGPERVAVLGLHVDYWNGLGWTDPFSRPAFTHRHVVRALLDPISFGEGSVAKLDQGLSVDATWNRGSLGVAFLCANRGKQLRAASHLRLQLPMTCGALPDLGTPKRWVLTACSA